MAAPAECSSAGHTQCQAAEHSDVTGCLITKVTFHTHQCSLFLQRRSHGLIREEEKYGGRRTKNAI